MGLVALLKSQGDDVPSAAGGGAAIFYLLMYVFANIAAFGIIVLVSHKSNSTQMKDFYGEQALAVVGTGDVGCFAVFGWYSTNCRFFVLHLSGRG